MSPATQRSSVDLPEPDLPSSATISPSERVKLTPSSTGRAWPSGVVNVLVTDSASMITVPVRVAVSLLTIESSSVQQDVQRGWRAHGEYRRSDRAYSRRQNSRLVRTT